MLIELDNVVLGYSKRPVVRIEHLTVQAGRCLGVFGPNGSGKTTLLRAIAGLLRPMSGAIERMSGLRRAYLPQLRTIDSSWPMSGFDAAAMASSSLSLLGWVGRRKAAIRQQLQTLGVDALGHRPFGKLSGGQQQRILLAGVLATDPQVLLLDEPTDGLDIRSRDVLADTLQRAKAAGLAIVLITHDPDELSLLADEVAHLHVAPDTGQPSWIDVVTDATQWTTPNLATNLHGMIQS